MATLPRPFSPGWSSGFGPAAPAYMFLEDHYINGQYIQAGDIDFEGAGGHLPMNWVPTPNVDPLTAGAVNNFYMAGPFITGLVRQQWVDKPVVKPVTYWVQIRAFGPFSSGWSTGFGPPSSGAVIPNTWGLTGLGSDLSKYPPKVLVFSTPIGNIPQ